MGKIFGTLLPFNSLLSRKYGRDLFANAKLFIDWISETGQCVWQMLPIAQTGWKCVGNHFDSPYWSYGVCVNPMFLPESERKGPFKPAPEEFEKDNSWVSGAASFSANTYEMGTNYWPDWEKKDLNLNPNFFVDQQNALVERFLDLKKYASSKGVELWGDVPFYLPVDSPLVWQNKKAFEIEGDGKVKFVAGSPGGKHFTKRQLWGFPLYNFNNLEDVWQCWKERLEFYQKFFDKVRLDAAVRFFLYEKMSVDDPQLDRREIGPGAKFFERVVKFSRAGGMDLYIEDISSLDMTELHKVANRLQVPGLSVFTMVLGPGATAFDPIDFDFEFPKNHVYFTSTHDTVSMISYLELLNEEQRLLVAQMFDVPIGSTGAMVQGVLERLKERCDTLIVSLLDQIGSRERINVPGIMDEKNWNYIMEVPVEDLPRKI